MEKSNLIFLNLIVITLLISMISISLAEAKLKDVMNSQMTKSDRVISDQLLAGKTFNVDIKGNGFYPRTLKIKSGDSVVWTNKDSKAHAISTDTSRFLNSGRILPNEVYKKTFLNKGTYSYHCSLHPTMKATIVVS